MKLFNPELKLLLNVSFKYQHDKYYKMKFLTTKLIVKKEKIVRDSSCHEKKLKKMENYRMFKATMYVRCFKGTVRRKIVVDVDFVLYYFPTAKHGKRNPIRLGQLKVKNN